MNQENKFKEFKKILSINELKKTFQTKNLEKKTKLFYV